jgi:phospholipid transport system transporter-binding protein
MMSTTVGFALPATVTVQEVTTVLQRLSAVLDASAQARSSAGAVLSLDTSALQHFDSSALALLLQLRRQAQTRGLRVELSGVPPRLTNLARLYGVADLLG